jgi:hypothetical protein
VLTIATTNYIKTCALSTAMAKPKESVTKSYPKSVDRLSILSAVLKARTSDGSSVNRSVDTSDGEQGTEHTGKTLAGQKTSGNREHVHVKGRWAPLHPNVVEDGSETHSDGEGSLGEDEALRRTMKN